MKSSLRTQNSASQIHNIKISITTAYKNAEAPKGIQFTIGSFINFLNSDNYFYDHRVIEELVGFIESNLNPHRIYGDAEIRPCTQKKKLLPYIEKSPLFSGFIESLICGKLFLQGSMPVRSDIFKDLGLFKDKYIISADYDFLLLDFFISKTCGSSISQGVSSLTPWKACPVVIQV